MGCPVAQFWAVWFTLTREHTFISGIGGGGVVIVGGGVFTGSVVRKSSNAKYVPEMRISVNVPKVEGRKSASDKSLARGIWLTPLSTPVAFAKFA